MVVVDSSALIPLIKIGRLNLLKSVFKKITVPQQIWEEVVIEGKKLGKAVMDFEEGKNKWFKVAELAEKFDMQENVEKNDFIVFKIAKNNNDILLTNDASLFYYALSQNVKCYWLTTLILVAVKKKKITKVEAENTLLELVNTAGLHLKSEILSELLMVIRNL